ncbi:HAD family hydrolase [Granulosicoccus antarcticus]|uniref:5-amino-6-(5-phospho-D-ribitylamino)uracil phosphatase YigB n=1 Tax=Granulosicoccus antarcticus IMCC3135 TaxID=1192854 RepID=A0A2Z2NQU0_9GAMM|nr:HAD family hydrolase [Granulosicoccus antarcticus]ASJ72361.1 5-amino-6-(5-phospho-D-ribitylamino)uracil phosphatase YigB [Granulosicoccus antarcticus IMCC3135]
MSVLEVDIAPASLTSVKAISFDLDDTLWHCAPAIAKADAALFDWFREKTPSIVAVHSPGSLQAYQSTVRQANPDVTRCVTATRMVGLRTLLREFGYAESLAEEAFAVFYRARSEVELYEGALDMLKLLKSRYLLAAITNGNADLGLIGISDYFDVVYAANLQLAPKPEPDMFHRCLTKLDLPASALLHIGDNPVTDVVGGLNASVQTLWFNQYNVDWPEHLPQPHFQAQTLSDIVTLLIR